MNNNSNKKKKISWNGPPLPCEPLQNLCMIRATTPNHNALLQNFGTITELIIITENFLTFELSYVDLSF